MEVAEHGVGMAEVQDILWKQRAVGRQAFRSACAQSQTAHFQRQPQTCRNAGTNELNQFKFNGDDGV